MVCVPGNGQFVQRDHSVHINFAVYLLSADGSRDIFPAENTQRPALQNAILSCYPFNIYCGDLLDDLLHVSRGSQNNFLFPGNDDSGRYYLF